MKQKTALTVIYSIFWTTVFVALAISLFLGLNSTYVWYLEKTSFNMYLAMTLLSILTAEAVLVLLILQRKRTRSVAVRLGKHIPSWQTLHRDLAPMVAMSAVFLAVSAFALFSLQSYLLPNYKINTVFILFTGILSKLTVGLFAVIAFRIGLRRMDLNSWI